MTKAITHKMEGIVKRVVSLLIISAFVFIPLSHTLTLLKAEAVCAFGFCVGPDIVYDPLNTAQNTITAGATVAGAEASQSLLFKEMTLDGIANALAKQVVQKMTASIVQWINSGFQGSPAFVTDLGGFLTEIADSVAGQFIEGAGLGFLCSPFQLEVRGALSIQYQESKSFESRSQCTFTGVMDNIKNFGTSFSSWQDWFEITATPQNNQYGALMMAQAELSARIVNAQGQEIKLLDFSGGFLSMKQCEPVEGGTPQCTIVTPGEVIEKQLNEHLSAGLQSLITADEINEIISALLGQLAQQAVTGLNGLLGLSSASGGEDSYLDQLKDEDTMGDSGLGDSNPIDDALDIEMDALKINKNIVTLITDAKAFTVASCTRPISAELATSSANAALEVTSGNLIIATLTDLGTRYTAATKAIDKQKLLAEYLDLKREDYLKSPFEVSMLKSEREEIKLLIADHKAMVTDACD